MSRDLLARNLPGWLVDLVRERFGSFAADAYRPPTNFAEAECWGQLLDKGYTVLRKGWPDFLVFTEDAVFAVEVKSEPDEVRPAQRVILETLARNGIDTYVWWTHGEVETIGSSRPPGEWMSGWDLWDEMAS